MPRWLSTPGTFGYGKPVFTTAYDSSPVLAQNIAEARELVRQAGATGETLTIGTTSRLAESLVIIWVYQRCLDVIAERGRQVGDGAGDPAERGDWGDGQQHVGDLVFGCAHRQRPGGAPFQADPWCPDRRQRPHAHQRRGLGIQPGGGQAEPEPGLVFDEAFVDDRQPAQDLLGSDRLAHTLPRCGDADGI